jgi:hypothetical protein
LSFSNHGTKVALKEHFKGSRVTLTAFLTAVGLNATFKPLSTEDFQQHLKTVHDFPEVFAVSLAENLSLYRDDPEAWVKGTDFAIQDVCSYSVSTKVSPLLTFT